MSFNSKEFIENLMKEINAGAPDFFSNTEDMLWASKYTEKYGLIIAKKFETDAFLKRATDEEKEVIYDIIIYILHTICIVITREKILKPKYYDIMFKEMVRRLICTFKEIFEESITPEEFKNIARKVMVRTYINFKNLSIRFNFKKIFSELKRKIELRFAIIRIEFGDDILEVDENTIDKIFTVDIKMMRDKFIKMYGYQFPLIKMTSKYKMRNSVYKIYIKNKRVRKGFFDYKDSATLDAILDALEKVLIEQVHKVFTEKTTKAYLNYVKRTYSKKVVKDLLKHLDVYSIKTIFCNLIQQKISIANICYVVKKLAEFSRTDNDIDSLTEKMKNVLM